MCSYHQFDIYEKCCIESILDTRTCENFHPRHGRGKEYLNFCCCVCSCVSLMEVEKDGSEV